MSHSLFSTAFSLPNVPHISLKNRSHQTRTRSSSQRWIHRSSCICRLIFLLLQRETSSSFWRWQVLPLRSYHFLSALWSSPLQSPRVSPPLLGQLLLHLADPLRLFRGSAFPPLNKVTLLWPHSPFPSCLCPCPQWTLITVVFVLRLNFLTPIGLFFFFWPWLSKHTCTYQVPNNCHVLRANDFSETHLIPLIW